MTLAPEDLDKPWIGWPVVVINLLLGTSSMVIGHVAFESEPWGTIAAPVGLAFIVGAFCIWLKHLSPRRRLRFCLDPPRRTVTVPIQRAALWQTAVSAVTLTLIPLWGLVLAWWTGGTWWPWLLATLPLVALTPQPLRSLWRRPSLVLTPETVAYRGLTVDSSLAWDDLWSITRMDHGASTSVWIYARYPHLSWRSERGFWIHPMESRPLEGSISVDVQGPMDHEIPTVLVDVLNDYLDTPALRSELGTTAFGDRVERARAAWTRAARAASGRGHGTRE